MTTPAIPVSWGELIDKITILEIKQARIAAPAALVNIRKEYALLSAIAQPVLGPEPASSGRGVHRSRHGKAA